MPTAGWSCSIVVKSSVMKQNLVNAPWTQMQVWNFQIIAVTIQAHPTTCSTNWRMTYENKIATLYRGALFDAHKTPQHVNLIFPCLVAQVSFNTFSNDKWRKTLDLRKSPIMNQTNENLPSLWISQGDLLTRPMNKKKKIKSQGESKNQSKREWIMKKYGN